MSAMWNDLMHLQISAGDKIVRTVVVYAALALILRVVGRRDLAQLNAFDLVVMLLLSNVVQNAIIGPDNSLLGGLLGAVVLVAVNAVMDRLAQRWDWLGVLLEGRPTVLASHGRWDERALRSVALRKADVDAALRRQNANSVADLETLTLEPGGAIVAQVRESEQAATRADVERLEAKLDALLATRPGS
jgi:uncharacterized membrane protein YcaP (DUF421 family)